MIAAAPAAAMGNTNTSATPATPAGTATPATSRAAGRPRWLYLANARVPSEKAHVFQIFQMVDALQQIGIDVELAFPRRANLPGVADRDPFALYGLRRRPNLTELRSLDAVKLVTIDLPALNRAPLPAAAFALQSASFAAAAAWHAGRSAARVVYGRDWPVLAAVLGLNWTTSPPGPLSTRGEGETAVPLWPHRGARPLSTAWRGGAEGGGEVTGRHDRPAPVIWEAHDLPQQRLARSALRRILPRITGVVAISHGLRDDLLAWGVPPGRLLVAPDAVDVTRFAGLPSPAEARRNLGLPDQQRAVVYTGHLYRWKGAHTLAVASRDLPADAMVYVVGGTPADLAAFRQFVAAERLGRVQVIGHVTPAQVPAWLAAADVLVLPNSGRDVISSRYTSPLKLFEYLAAGRPVVASDLPSLREVLAPDQNAVLVPPDDPAALAAGITRVLHDASLASRLAEAGQQTVAGRTWDERARRIVEFVHSLPESAHDA